jgi:hypothetical protein
MSATDCARRWPGRKCTVSSILPRPWLSADTESRAYILPPGAEVAVQAGETVPAGGAIANLPPLPRVIALADSLRLSHDASLAAIQALDGTTIEAGGLLGKHRVGLRTRTLHAPYSGTIRGVPELGAVAILPGEEQQTLRADRPGVVATIEPDRATITSRVLRCRLAFITGLGRAYGRLALAPNGRGGAPAERPDTDGREAVITALPHIASMADLTAALRRAPGPIIVGTVSEAVAWDMLLRQIDGGDDAEPIIAVLLGPGESGIGERAIEGLRRFDGAIFDLDPSGGTMTIFTEASTEGVEEEPPGDRNTGEALVLDPARWHLPCVVAGTAELGLLETGVRSLLVRTSPTGDGAAWVPVVNVAKCADS